MFYIVESSKSFAEVIFDLEPVVQRLGYVVQQSNDIGETLRGRGIDFDEDCAVFDICNYRQTERLLTLDLRLAAILPWRIAVFTENGTTRLGVVRPQCWLAGLGDGPDLGRLAREIEERIVQIVDEIR